MGYKDGEAAALNILRTVSGFTTDNTSRGNWSMLNKGRSRIYGVLKPGQFRRQPGKTSTNNWRTTIQVWVRYVDDGETLQALETAVDNVIAQFDKYPHLGNEAVVTDSNLRSGSEVQEMWKRGGGPAWLKQDLYLDWDEQTITTFAE